MSEEELNIKYIRHKLGVDMLLAKEILKLCSERYIEGIEQGKFDRLMLEQENQRLKEKIILLQASKPMLELTKYYGERDKYKSVLDEIREVINQNMSSYSSCIKAFDEIEEILDKVNND